MKTSEELSAEIMRLARGVYAEQMEAQGQIISLIEVARAADSVMRSDDFDPMCDCPDNRLLNSLTTLKKEMPHL